ncbi:DNA repair protein RecO [Candidatus Pelagibacter sp. RS39]|jgi:DNA repair protein RecO (recombination protein O)|uniref:DNA repair protein RecO n=1 Tax=Candidatus Pelagibacter sp. RS39 TaxID=1977864 RepID=UPI000A169D76|nr:DNA repair protein RecO [Candidatus Pelagibacter sp. RS39]ARJ47910.1 DNA repair protein RecO [Candidatus Pelagibacter sp. RS39]
MNWDDTGFLISKNRYNENSLISEFYTKNHGKISGIVFGGTSKKIKNYLQIGNQLYLNYNSKSENKLGYFRLEIQKVYSPIYFENPQKLSCINSVMSLIRLLTAELQSNIKIFDLIEKFYLILSNDKWLKDYIFWELELLKTIGFDLELNNLATKELLDDKIVYVVKSKTEKKIIPNFLIDKKIIVDDLSTLLNGLKLVSDFLEKTILKPNNLNYPISRTQFINSFK